MGLNAPDNGQKLTVASLLRIYEFVDWQVLQTEVSVCHDASSGCVE